VAATIGYPVSHSMSPLLHQAAFDALGLDWVSVAFGVSPGLARDALSAMRALRIAGMSVTMPHKADAANASDELSPLAKRLGAVNCIINRDGVLVGDSTDGAGLLAALDRSTGVKPLGLRCAVIGAGGAGRAAVAALADAGAAEVVVVNRTRDRAEEAAALAGSAGRVGDPSSLSEVEIVIQATPAGMEGSATPEGDPAMALGLHAGQVVMDLVYVPTVTPFLRAAAERGATTVGGIGMLVHQAALAIHHWTGLTVPVGHMWDVAQAAIATREPS
jgi:shikimate dehydrogenase